MKFAYQQEYKEVPALQYNLPEDWECREYLGERFVTVKARPPGGVWAVVGMYPVSGEKARARHHRRQRQEVAENGE